MLSAFPLKFLPEEEVWLEEDVDLLGFSPLRRGGMKVGVTSGGGLGEDQGTLEEISKVGKNVHPNEEQLMRIADVETDARLIAEVEVRASTAVLHFVLPFMR